MNLGWWKSALGNKGHYTGLICYHTRMSRENHPELLEEDHFKWQGRCMIKEPRQGFQLGLEMMHLEYCLSSDL